MILLLAACGVQPSVAPFDVAPGGIAAGTPASDTADGPPSEGAQSSAAAASQAPPVASRKGCGETAPTLAWSTPPEGDHWLVDGGVTVDADGVTHSALRQGPRFWDVYPVVIDADGDLVDASLRVWLETDGDGRVDTTAPPTLVVPLTLTGTPDCGAPTVDAAFACAVEGSGGLDIGSCRVAPATVYDIGLEAVDDAGHASPAIVWTGTSPA